MAQCLTDNLRLRLKNCLHSPQTYKQQEGFELLQSSRLVTSLCEVGAAFTWTLCSLQIPPEGALHRHRHPPWRRRWGGLLHHRQGHDRFLPQIRGILPRHWRSEGEFQSVSPGKHFNTLKKSWILIQPFQRVQDIGAGKGKYYAVNYPLRDGIDDESYEAIFKPVSCFVCLMPLNSSNQVHMFD